MYTIDDQKEDLYEVDDYDNNWDNRKGLIFKIIIIILCIIVLVWLIKALKTNRNTDNGERHIANVEKVRLAAEDYYFIQNNKDKDSSISVSKLKSVGLINSDIIDADNKVCNDSASLVTLDKEIDTYTMKVKLSCSTNDKEEVFYYHRNTLACLNCSSNTHMDGTTVVVADEPEPTPVPYYEPEPVVAEPEESPYKCDEWTEWTKERINNPDLSERTKTLVLGVKKGENKTVYGKWSKYKAEKITEKPGIEVQSKVVTEDKWSENKTGTDIDFSNPKIRVISVETIEETTTVNKCKGFVLNNSCYSNYVAVDNLTYKEYNSGNYLIKKEYCEGARTLKNSDGVNVLTYIDCEFNTKLGPATETITNSYDVYTYQTLESSKVKYYRYRTVETTKEDDVYTDKKYEEDDLPEGFVKVDGSEETYYSYRLTYCVK